VAVEADLAVLAEGVASILGLALAFLGVVGSAWLGWHEADGLAAVWKVAEPLLSMPPQIQLYAPGSWGPAQARDLIAPGRWLLGE